jgi:endonuclease-3
MKGSYSLVVEVSESREVVVGSLGSIAFDPGFYVYNGSAFGPGGLKRVGRHREKSGESESPHWHIDYLLVQDCSDIVEVFKEKDSDHECGLSSEMSEVFTSVQGFGCSDCSCGSHLFYSEDRQSVVDFLERFYSE